MCVSGNLGALFTEVGYQDSKKKCARALET